MPPFPRALGYLWNVYIRLRRRKGAGFSGPMPIDWQDIDAFIRRSGLRLAPWEIEVIEAVDDLFLNPEAKKPQAQEAQSVNSSDGAGVKAIVGAVGARRVVVRKKGGNAK